MIEKIIKYRCTDCQKEFSENPIQCPCSISAAPGKTIGPFLLIRKEGSRRWKATCLLCSMDIFIDYSNLTKQKSCGCKPRHIQIVKISSEGVKYNCSRCRKNSLVQPPVLEWCCDER